MPAQGSAPPAWAFVSWLISLLPRTSDRGYSDDAGKHSMMWFLPDRLPTNLFRYVFAVSWQHQIALVILTVVTFLLETVPLEIQRRVVNDLVKARAFQVVVVLGVAYVGAVLVQGATKLGLNVYRSWVGENAIRDLRRHVFAYLRRARTFAPGAETRGVGTAMIVS